MKSGYNHLKTTWYFKGFGKHLNAGNWVDEGGDILKNNKNEWMIIEVSRSEIKVG